MMNKKGIDASKWQGEIDFQKVKNNGVEFVIIREGYGKKSPTQIDKKFKVNYEMAKSVGLPVGVYHYSYADSVSDAKLEAQFCLENIQGMKLEYPVVIDIEDKEILKLNNRQRTDNLKAFCEEMENAGYYAMVYCNLYWWNNYLYKEELENKYDLWLAQWQVENPSVTCGIWQYSETGKIDGINGNVDLNIAYKDYPSIMKYNGLNGFKKQETSIPTTYTTYTVVKGDSLWSIAQKLLGDGTKWQQIQSINSLSSTIIYPNQTLKIPK
ncbi:hypothetical protein M9Y10_013519 [Tritrichomonas musculus]|uniref:LysM domain-containing protein n=1 Tax=Tritrichomonas musculus TaxID=1915356 RepID=A0ABR2GN35_9EUKA